ncbi:hypothetical protein ACGF3G_49475 [Streptomyces sp. NPDC048179]|uniref:hypothetical protein n=1 Tax=Streptomyces sp. NPDC048179 TaxID=3365506 RepID=UPI003718AF48
MTLLAGAMPWTLANAVITVASTVLCTELHARFTFGTGKRAGWHEHWRSVGSVAVAYAVTCAVMFLLHLLQASPGTLTEQIVYLGASALAGLGRFLFLRLYIFVTGHRPPATGHRSRNRATTPPSKPSLTSPPPPRPPPPLAVLAAA